MIDTGPITATSHNLYPQPWRRTPPPTELASGPDSGDIVTQLNDKFVQHAPLREIRKPFKAFRKGLPFTMAASPAGGGRRSSIPTGHLIVTLRKADP